MYASAKHGKERCRRLQTVGFFQPQPRCIFNLRFPAAKRGKTGDNWDEIRNRPCVQRDSMQISASHDNGMLRDG